MGSSSVGVDIGTSTITLVEMQMVKGTPTITEFAGKSLPPNSVKQGEISDVTAVAEALKELWKDSSTKNKRIHMSVSNPRSAVRAISLPHPGDLSALEGSLRYQVADSIPIPIEYAQLDHHVLSEATHPASGEGTVNLLVAAAHVDMLEKVSAVAAKAGLRCMSIDLSPFALLRALAPEHTTKSSKPEIIVDIGGGTTDIVVHAGGQPMFVRMLNSGGEILTEALMSSFSMDRDSAEQSKHVTEVKQVSSPEGEILRGRVDSLLGEIRKSQDFYMAQAGTDKLPKRAVLVGGTSMMPGLKSLLADELRLPADRGNPFALWQMKSGVYDEPTHSQMGPLFGTAIGLAAGGLK